jgi:hypothetical protein
MNQVGIAEKAIELEAERVIVVDRRHGEPGRINLFQTSSTDLKPVPPLMLISGIRLRREFKKRTRCIPSSLITLEPKDSANLNRLALQLSKYYGFSILPIDEAGESHCTSMHLSFGSSQHIHVKFILLKRMCEIGPRVTLSKLIWEVTP